MCLFLKERIKKAKKKKKRAWNLLDILHKILGESGDQDLRSVKYRDKFVASGKCIPVFKMYFP